VSQLLHHTFVLQLLHHTLRVTTLT